MKRPLLTALALWLLLCPATVCKGREVELERHQSPEGQAFNTFHDATSGPSIGTGNIRFHNFSVEICKDPTSLGPVERHDPDQEASGALTRIGGTILYHVAW